MGTRIMTTESHVKLQAPELPADIRSGGEQRPFEYPHLYQIQAGDWRISYAVEHNRLAILVLEVLGADGEPMKDPASEKMAKKMKIKLLDWPEGSENVRDVPPEELTKKLKIKLLDLTDDSADDGEVQSAHRSSRIKLAGVADTRAGKQQSREKGRITLLEASEPGAAGEPTGGMSASGSLDESGRKVTPLDEPSL